VLSNPLVIEAAETAFVPVAIYNNTEGDHDAAVRERYEEPAWNYPVVRVVDAKGEDLIERVANQWHLAGATSAMVAGLEAAEADVPAYLRLLAAEAAGHARGVETAVFGMT
jgi:hypothetical protein